MKKTLFSIVLLLIACFTKAQEKDSVIAKLGKLPNIDYELQPRVGDSFLSDYISGKIAVPVDLPSNSSDYAVACMRIDSNGKVNDIRLVKSFSPVVDSGVLHILNSLPAIKPARANGHCVPLDFAVGVRFGKVHWNDPAVQSIGFAFTPMQLRDPNNSDMIFVAVQSPPSFPGGFNALMEYFKKNMVYPRTAKTKGIQGMVIINFVVRKDGSLTDFMVLRSPNDDLSEEALRVMHNCPAFTPGMQNDHPVNCSYTVPMKFNF